MLVGQLKFRSFDFLKRILNQSSLGTKEVQILKRELSTKKTTTTTTTTTTSSFSNCSIKNKTFLEFNIKFVKRNFSNNNKMSTSSTTNSSTTTNSNSSVDSTNNVQKFKKSCLGGTFDRLHPGHYVLLNKSIEVTTQIVIIGLTDESMNKSKKYAELIESFETRRDNLVKYMKSQNDKLDYQVFKLNEPYGPAIVDPEIEAMIVSDETAKSAEKCNVIRKEKGMNPLQIVVIPCLPNNDDKSDVKLSSTYFRMLEFQKRQQQQQK